MDQLSNIKTKLNEDEHARMRENFSYWEDNARKFGTSNEVSWGDLNMMRLEIRTVLEELPKTGRFLDAGCSNGFSTFAIAREAGDAIDAFDYSPKSVTGARQAQKNEDPEGKIRFEEGNILDIPFPDKTYSAAYTIRVLINLPSWERQQEAIQQIHKKLKTGGLYLCSEAFTGSLKKLNGLRELAGLPPLKAPSFNLYMEENAFESFAENLFEIVAIRRFSSVYYTASRFMRYLTMDSGDPDSYDNPVNNFFAEAKETDQSGDFGIQKLYVLKKR